MTEFNTGTESETGQKLTPQQVFEITAAREARLSHLLMLYIGTGLVFMLLPGTFLGVWNLLTISNRHAPSSVSPAWIQAHGHAQVFGWIGSFILGIGFYSIPKLRRMRRFALWVVWTSWVLWTCGVALRWLVGIYEWQWRTLLPISAILELCAFLLFFRTVAGHRSESGKSAFEHWREEVCVARGLVRDHPEFVHANRGIWRSRGTPEAVVHASCHESCE